MQAAFVNALLLIVLVGSDGKVSAREPGVTKPGGDPSPQPQKVHGFARLDGKTPAERGAAIMRFVAQQKLSEREETSPKASAAVYAAQLMLHLNTKSACKKLHASVEYQIDKAKSRGGAGVGPGKNALDPFDKAALVNTYFLAKQRIPIATAFRIRDYVAFYAHREWKGYGAMNYRLMMDGAGFLAAEEWSDLIDADGLNAEQIRAATRGRLLGYFDTICRHNYEEYGSPIYAAVNLSAVRMLAEFARDPEIRKRATLTLDAMLVDIACSWNQGYNIGSAARAKYWVATDTSPEAMGATAAAAWVWFGAPRSISTDRLGWIHSFWMATPGTYELPELVMQVAQTRSSTHEYRGSVPAMKKQNVHRTIFQTSRYGLCSQWDHPSKPTDGLYKESRRNMLKWVSDRPSSTFAVCMENPRRPYNLQEGVANPLGYGENPYSQYLQHERSLLGVYCVPESYPYYKLYAPFTLHGAIRRRIEKSGWVFCHNGLMLMGFRTVQPYTWANEPWNGNDMLWCTARKNGWVLETSELAPFAGGGQVAELDRFAAAVLAKCEFDGSAIDQNRPRLRYKTLSGSDLDLTWLPHEIAYDQQSRIDGRPVDYSSWPLHENPWVRQSVETPVLHIQFDQRALVYDFNKWTREERSQE